MADADRAETNAFLVAAESVRRRGKKPPASAKLLHDPLLQTLVLKALGPARCTVVDGDSAFAGMIWYGGATDTHGGLRLTLTVSQFVTHVLEARSQEIAAKRCGWVFTPTSNTDGWRGNESTTAMHALLLDCDGTGVWDNLLAVLSALGLAFMAYQSGGWSPTSSKWRVILPLAQPFIVTSDDDRDAWKYAYLVARVVFGSIARLTGEGFDAACDTPTQPWFLSERRTPDAAARVVLWRPGTSLDIEALVASLPEIPVDNYTSGGNETVELGPLENERLEEIVSALVQVTSRVPSGRRALYMALPGALLDRGVCADDVRVVCKTVSERYPGGDREKHRDNVHSAETTIDRWEREETVTRIGTLAHDFPSVAMAIDAVLPDPTVARLRERFKSAAELAEISPVTVESGSPKITAPVSLFTLRKRLVALRRWKMRAGGTQIMSGAILGALVDGEELTPWTVDENGQKKLLKNAKGTTINSHIALQMAVSTVAYNLPSTPWKALSELLRPSLSAMLEEGETTDSLLKLAEGAFLRALGSREERDKERFANAVAERLKRCL